MIPTPETDFSTTTTSPLLPIHRGAIDRTTITTSPPSQVMHSITGLLLHMGVRVTAESAFRLRCVRPSSWEGEDGGESEEWEEQQQQQRGEGGSSSSDSSGSDTETEASSSSAKPRAANGLPKSRARARGIQVHRITSPETNFPATTPVPSPPNPSLPAPKECNNNKCTLYGPTPSSDPAHEVRFSVELTQLAGLPGTYSLDIRRLKGHLRSYKYVYDTLRDRAELNCPLPAST